MRIAPYRRIAVVLAACSLGVSLLATPALADTSDGSTVASDPSVASDTTVAPDTSTAATTVTADTTVAGTQTASVSAPADLPAEETVVRAAARRGRLAVGDSLTVGVTPRLRRLGFSIQAKVGRQFSTAPGIVASYGGRLPRNVVIALGTNGTVSLAACRAVVRRAGPARRVFLVTNRVPRSWQDSNNATLRACDRSFAANRVRIIDWHAASAGHPQWFSGDSIHPSSSGRAAFARLIDRAVDRYGR